MEVRLPVLRQGPDNTLSEVLGNLGSSLAQNLNPMNQIRSQNMLSEIQQRNWEIQHAQSIDAANRNAANVFYNSDLPFDPATKEMVAAGLRSGTLNVNNYIDALTKTGSLKANQTASTMYAAAHPDLPPRKNSLRIRPSFSAGARPPANSMLNAPPPRSPPTRPSRPSTPPPLRAPPPAKARRARSWGR